MATTRKRTSAKKKVSYAKRKSAKPRASAVRRKLVVKAPKKIDIKSIVIERAEGPSKLCGIKKRFTKFADANAFLRQSSRTVTGQGYDKHDVWLTWRDGTTYKGRWDVTRDGGDTNIGKHLEDTIAWTSGSKTEARMFLMRYKVR